MNEKLLICDLTRSADGFAQVLPQGKSVEDFLKQLYPARLGHEKGAQLILFLTPPDVFPAAEEYYLFAPKQAENRTAFTHVFFMLPTANLYVCLATSSTASSTAAATVQSPTGTTKPLSVLHFCEKFLVQLKFLACEQVGQHMGERPEKRILFSSWPCNIQDWLPLLPLHDLKQLICESFADTYALMTQEQSSQPLWRTVPVVLDETCAFGFQPEKRSQEETEALTVLPRLEEVYQSKATVSQQFVVEYPSAVQQEEQYEFLGKVYFSLTTDAHRRITQIYLTTCKVNQGEFNDFLLHLQGKPATVVFLNQFTQLYADHFGPLFLPAGVALENQQAFVEEWQDLFGKLLRADQ